MKQKIFFTALFLIFVCGFVLHKASTENTSIKPLTPPPGNDVFILGAMGNNSDWSRVNISDPNKFGMNIWHRYPGSEYDAVNNRYYPKGWTDNDLLFADYSQYETGVKKILDSNANSNLKSLLCRPKIVWLTLGERSDYQCEETQNVDPNYWFYSFQRHKTGVDIRDNSAYGWNQWVRYCRTGTSTNSGSWVHMPDTVAARLITNNEQQESYNNSNKSAWKWFIKPSIRIDRDFANNPSNENVLVCKIDVYNSDGYIYWKKDSNKIKSIDIRVRNFKSSRASQYDGSYMQDYKFVTPDWIDTSSQDLSGVWNPHDIFRFSRGKESCDTQWADLCKADIRIYWYGNCDMWIDYVRVDNEVADGLLNSY